MKPLDEIERILKLIPGISIKQPYYRVIGVKGVKRCQAERAGRESVGIYFFI